jgi:hypothetical protein
MNAVNTFIKRCTGILLLVILLLAGQQPAAARETILTSVSFDDCAQPAGWQVIDAGNGCVWEFDSILAPNNTGGVGCYASAISDGCGIAGSTVDTVLETDVLDFSGLRAARLTFKYDAPIANAATFSVSVSGDNGASWQAVWQQTVNDDGPKTADIDLSFLADNRAAVLVRFQYTAADDWWWQLDDIVLSADKPFAWNLFLPAIIGR